MARRKPEGPRLTKAEKNERDARATRWMNNRKIERVAEGAFRHGWTKMSAEYLTALIDAGLTDLDEAGELIAIVPDDGRYRIYHSVNEGKAVIVRKIETFGKS